MNVLGLVPARGGSKGIPRKNLADLCGRPLIAWTIDCALACPALSRVIVSTDDEAIAAAARAAGAEVPFLRPGELAGDEAGALGVMRHALAAVETQHGEPLDALVYLQPTSPLRRPAHVEAAVARLLEDGCDSVVSVVRVPHNFTPGSLMREQDGWLQPLVAGPPLLSRQSKPLLYARNGPAVLVVRRALLVERGRLYGERTGFVEMGALDSVDVDGPDDLELARLLMTERLRREGGA